MRRRRLFCVWVLAMVLTWAACDDDGDSMRPPDGNGAPAIDLSEFLGCWHVTGAGLAFGQGPCRAALDSIIGLLTVRAGDSLFASIDTVTDLVFVTPYRGTGDFTGSNIVGRNGSVSAVYHHAAGECSLITTISGDLFAENGDREFTAFYIVNVRFGSAGPCSTAGSCAANLAFQGKRRPASTCAGP